MRKGLLALCWLLLPLVADAVEYTVTFSGVLDAEILQKLETSSQLFEWQHRPLPNQSALKKRAEGDISRLAKVMHGYGHYNARVEYVIDPSKKPTMVRFLIDPGPVYLFDSVKVLPCFDLPMEEIGIVRGAPALPKQILEGEERLRSLFSTRGYPFAIIKEREVLANQSKKTIDLIFHLDPGPEAFFGKISITGNVTVRENWIRQKIFWRPGERFDPRKINCTVLALEATGLFRSVSITYPETAPEDPRLPIVIEVDESKHRSLSLGLSYSTQRGPGFTTEWEHRNFRGGGERLSFDANILQYMQEIKLWYALPGFLMPKQDLVWAFEAEHDKTEGFEETWASLSSTIERQVGPRSRFSYGAMYKHLQVADSDHDGTFDLLKAPCQWRWSNADNLLDPTCGSTLYFKAVPTLQLNESAFAYAITHLSGSIYFPSPSKRFVAAARAQFGSILGSNRKEIPPSERLYAGSESTLRGYKYFTVSPLDDKHHPIGGRSLMVFSLEERWRISDQWGGVLFYDIGNVDKESFPTFNGKFLQSTGFGLRYFTPVGPLRFDLAFPLNRRKHVDGPFQFYFSVGQAF